MAGPPKPPNGKKSPTMPAEEDLIAFDHIAAGHEGMSSNASGSLVIKPCWQAEIDFYESAKDHKLFLAHMPTYMGALRLNQDQSAADPIAPLLAQAGQPVAIHGMHHLSTSSLPPIAELLNPLSHHATASNAIKPAVTPVSAKRASWNPSGGKKLKTDRAVVLENVAAGFKHPNILDVKLGARLWADDAPMSKRRKLDDVSKETTSGTLGFRIAGMKMWVEKPEQKHTKTLDANIEVKDGYRIFNKHYGRGFTAEKVRDGFAEYLGGLAESETSKKHLKRVRGKLIAKRIIRELESMQYVLEHEESRMYSASVLIVYEGDETALEEAIRDEEMQRSAEKENEARDEQMTIESSEDDEGGNVGMDEEDDEDEIPKVSDVRLIDFAHASWTPGQGPDENMLQGLRSVIKLLRELADV